MELDEMLQDTNIDDSIENLEDMENELQNDVAMAAVAAGVGVANQGMDIITKGSKLVGDALAWSDKVSDKAADVQKIKDILKFIEKEQSTLVLYAGKLLTKSIKGLSLQAHAITLALDEVHYLAKAVKVKSMDTRDFIEMQDELSEGRRFYRPTEESQELWGMSLESLLGTLKDAYTRTRKVREKMQRVQADIVMVQADIKSMVTLAKHNVDNRVREMTDNYKK